MAIYQSVEWLLVLLGFSVGVSLNQSYIYAAEFKAYGKALVTLIAGMFCAFVFSLLLADNGLSIIPQWPVFIR